MQLVCVGVVPPWLWEVSASPVQSCAQIQQHFSISEEPQCFREKSQQANMIKRLKPVIFNSETQIPEDRKAALSQMSTVQKSHPLTTTVPCHPAFLRSCGQGVITKATSPGVWDFCPKNVCASPLFPWGLSLYKTLRIPKLLYLHLTPLWIVD